MYIKTSDSIRHSKEKHISTISRSLIATALFWSTNGLLVFLGLLNALLIVLFSKDKTYHNQLWAKFWGKALFSIATRQVRIEGLENIPKDIPVIYTPNHQSNLDWMILLSILPLPFRFIIKKELFKIPIFGLLLKGCGYFSIDREVKKKAYDTLTKVIDIVKKESIVIFPEGTRTHDGNVEKFKRGGLLLAFKVGSPIIPVAISGSFKILPRYTWIITPGKLSVKIGPPISFEEYKAINKENYQKAINKVRDVVITMLSELERENV